MPRPCHNDHVLSPETCRVCWLTMHSEEYASLWGERPVTVAQKILPRCIHRLEPDGQLWDCDACRGKTKMRSFGCSVHHHCLPMHRHSGVMCCLDCPDRQPGPTVPNAGQVRHLAYHLYPLMSREAIWTENLRMLLDRISLFNGQRLCGVAVDAGTLPLDKVRNILEPWGFTVLAAPNNRDRREGTTYLQLLEILSHYQGSGDCFFFGQAKGIGLPQHDQGSQRWRQALYHLCLDYWPHVRELLTTHPLVGPFLRPGFRFPENQGCSWHLSGTFRWHRNRDVFSRNWKQLTPTWTCVETWPSSIFEMAEVGECGPRVEEYGLALYLEEYWQRRANREVSDYYAAHAHQKEQPMLLTCVVCSHNKPRWIHDAIRSVLTQESQDWELLIVDSGALFEQLRPYEQRGNIRVFKSPHGERCQGWQHNWLLDLGIAQGDLIHFLSDDDVLHPSAFGSFLTRAREHPDEQAWYLPAKRLRIRGDGRIEDLGLLDPGGTLGLGGETPACKIDGMQFCVRRDLGMSQRWPEEDSARPMADAIWMQAIGDTTPIIRLEGLVGAHRHTPHSTFTK